MNSIKCTKKEYATRSIGELEDFLGCTIKHDLTKTTLNISQPDIINRTTQCFNKDMESLMTFNTPATPHKGILRNQETDTNISYDLQKIYRSGIGSLIYLVKHSRTKLSNVVHEISQCMYETNMSHHKALLLAIKYIIDTKYYCYQMKPYENINVP